MGSLFGNTGDSLNTVLSGGATLFEDIKKAVDKGVSDITNRKASEEMSARGYAALKEENERITLELEDLRDKYDTLVSTSRETAEWVYNPEYDDYTCTKCGDKSRRRTPFCSLCGKQMVEKVGIRADRLDKEKLVKSVDADVMVESPNESVIVSDEVN